MTVLVGQDLPTPDQTTLPWSPRFDRVLGSRLWMLGLSLLLGLVAAAFVIRWLVQTRDAPPPFPLQYAPPEGVGPAQGHYLATESTGRQQFVASLMNAADHGVVHLAHRDDGSWVIRNTAEGSAVWSAWTRGPRASRPCSGTSRARSSWPIVAMPGRDRA